MNILYRTTVSILFSLFLLAANGCANSDIAKVKVQEDPRVIQQKEQSVPPELVVTDESDRREVSESDKMTGWKQIEARVSLSELTEHGSQPIDHSKKYSFSIYFPGNWTMISSVLYDADNKKVAEIPPVILLKSGERSLFLSYKPADDCGEELISKEAIETNSYQGSKTITKIDTESGSWYPHIYRLVHESYGFTIVLYSEVINTGDQALFDRIVNTITLSSN